MNSYDVCGTIREILGGCVEEGHFSVFVDGLFFLRHIQSG